MPDAEHTALDHEAFFSALREKKVRLGLSWRELGRELDVSPSTFSRLARGRRPDVDTFVKLITWLGEPVETFTGKPPNRPPSEDAIAVLASALRRDPFLRSEDVHPLVEIFQVAYDRFRVETDRSPGEVDNDARGDSNPPRRGRRAR